jgi:hypothetical protein
METKEEKGAVFDAVDHFYEPREAFTRYQREHYRDVIRYVKIDGRTKVAVLGQISDYVPNPTTKWLAP